MALERINEGVLGKWSLPFKCKRWRLEGDQQRPAVQSPVPRMWSEEAGGQNQGLCQLTHKATSRAALKALPPMTLSQDLFITRGK